MFYELKLKREQDGGRAVTEVYLTDCEFFAEAEHAGLSLCAGSGDVVAIYRSDIYEIVNPFHVQEDYYKATIAKVFTASDGGTKEQRYRVLVNAGSLEAATLAVTEYMKQGLDDMLLVKIERSKVVGVLRNVE